jgi:hypothetical protein
VEYEKQHPVDKIILSLQEGVQVQEWLIVGCQQTVENAHWLDVAWKNKLNNDLISSVIDLQKVLRWFGNQKCPWIVTEIGDPGNNVTNPQDLRAGLEVSLRTILITFDRFPQLKRVPVPSGKAEIFLRDIKPKT